ncbi:DUF2493 domain-containing protein [Rhodococcus hoagii]|uniref:DUF2493 domain-containing protein n=1 Tax=Rhodococcus hoagii TaxID=43767 RepID=A0A9Q4ZIL7_RHOHA|nr:DUF2493 domain-containing protein [Prescottella equi]NKT77227.1 DUF2493 domain-containing protein [Prescottella equi]NKZ81011.1 DUF2493 domain-containing protein [Prescottella equi]
MTRRILVTGSRDWTNEAIMRSALGDAWLRAGQSDDAILVHGAARGADSLAARLWEEGGFRTEAYPARWNQYGKAAGFIRNKLMVDLGADECIAFPLGISRGTRSCMTLARAAGIPVYDYEPN